MKIHHAMHRKLWPIIALSILSGCSSNGVLPPLTTFEKQLETLKPKLAPVVGNAKSHLECMAPLTTNLNHRLITLIETVKQNPDHRILDTQLGPLQDAGILDQESRFQRHIDAVFAKLADDAKADTSADTHPDPAKLANTAKRAESYLIAYFRKGIAPSAKVGVALLEADTSDLKSKIAAQLNRKPDDPIVAKVVDTVEAKLGPRLAGLPDKLAGKNASGFIGREGTQYGFPGVTSEGGRVNIDHSQVAADVIRVLMEALRDSYAPLPALPESTAANLDKSASNVLTLTGDALIGTWTVDRVHSRQVNLKADKFADIEAKARSAESSFAGAVGKAIRGGSWGSLNNEAIAKVIETVAGVLARHLAERAQWCMAVPEAPAAAETGVPTTQP